MSNFDKIQELLRKSGLANKIKSDSLHYHTLNQGKQKQEMSLYE